MLGPRTRSAALRESACAAPVVLNNDGDEREPKKVKVDGATKTLASSASQAAEALAPSNFRISVVTMTGATILIDGATAADTILSLKERVFAANRKLYVFRQRLVYSAGPRGMDALADDETLGGACVAQDGSAELDVLLVDLTAAELKELGEKLLNAASNGRENDVFELMNKGVDIDYRNHAAHDRHQIAKFQLNWTALMHAAEMNRIHCVRLLLDGGAGTETQSVSGGTALMYAAANGHSDCVRLLLEASANKEASNNGGWTALIRAAEYGHIECVRLLLENGADMETANDHGRTALIGAAEYGRSDIARVLVESGADMDANHGNGSAIIRAADRGCVYCVRLLLEFGADSEIKDDDGKTALMMAVLIDDEECVRLLLEAGADKVAQDNTGMTPLDHARTRGNSDAIIDLLKAQ